MSLGIFKFIETVNFALFFTRCAFRSFTYLVEHGPMPRDERPLVQEVDSTRPSSDFSSIGPSQSASQTNWDSQQLPEPINMMAVITDADSGMLGQPINDNTVLDAKRLSAGPTMPRPHSAESTTTSSLYHIPMPTTYKLETVTYAPAIALVVPRKDVLSSPPPPILGSGDNTPLASGPSLANPLAYAPVTEELSEDQGLHIKMHIPAAHAINEYDIPTAEVVGTGTSAAWRHSRGGSEERSTQMGYSTPQSQSQRTSLVAFAFPSEPISEFGPNVSSTSTLHPQRHILERRITEEELQGNTTVDLSRGGGGQAAVTSRAVTSALVEVFDDPENNNYEEEEEEEDDDDELPIDVEVRLIQQGKLAVVENPRFMSEERKRELEKDRKRERMKVAGVEEGQDQEFDVEPVKEKKRFSFLHQHPKSAGMPTPTQGQSQSQSDIGHATFAPAINTPSAAPSTPKTSPSKAGDNAPYTSPSKTSPSKRFFGSLRGLFGVRQPVSPRVPSQVQDSSPSSRFGTRKQDSSPSRFRARSPSRIPTADSDSDADADSDVDSPTKAGGGLQALFRGAGAKKKAGSAGGTRWSTRTDKNIKKLTRTGGLDDDDDPGGYLSQVVGGSGGGIAGNAVVKAGLVGGEVGGVSAGPSGMRKRSASDIGPPPAVVGGSKVPTSGGKKLKKTQSPSPPPPSASELYTSSPQRNNTNGVAVHAHAPTTTPSTPMKKSSNAKTAAQGKRSVSVDEGARRMNVVPVQRGEVVVGQTLVGGGGGDKEKIVDLGKRRRRAASDIVGPPLTGKGSVITTATNASVGAPVRGVPATGTSAMSKDYSSDTATAASGHAVSPLKKSVVRNPGPGPAAASILPATPNPATATPSRPTPTRKTSIGKTHATPNTPANIKAGGSGQPHAQPQPHHQHPTSHFTSSSGGGATVLAAGGTHPSGTLISHPGWDAQALPTAGGSLSRNNSILSVASAPATGGSGGGMGKTKKQKQTVLGHGMGSGTSLGRRSSLGSSSGHGGGGGQVDKKAAMNVATGGSSTGPISSVVQPTQAAPSLMSIVEDVARHNREWSQESSQLLKNKNKMVGGLKKDKFGSLGMVDVVKAPPRVGRDELAHFDPATIKSLVMETSTTNLAPSGVISASGGGGGGARLVDIKAPGSVFDQRKVKNVGLAPAGMHRQASNSTPDLTQSQQAYHLNLTRRASVTAIPTATTPASSSSSKRPAKSPLRSALKNPSRTPSPLPGPFLVTHLQKQQQYQQQQAVQEGSRHSVKSNIAIVAPVPISPPMFSTILGPVASPQPSQTQSATKAPLATDTRPIMVNARVASYDSTSQRRKGKGQSKAVVSEEVGGGELGDAGDSASTDDTGSEIFYTDDEGHHSEAGIVSSADNRAVHAASSKLNGHAVVGGSSELSHSTTSTAVERRSPLTTISAASQPTTPPPRRRKSVRVSLQPTFSPSPPAIEYDDEEEQKRHAPWVWKQDHHITEGVGAGQHVHAPVPLAAPSPLLNLGHRQKVVEPEQSARVYDIWEDSSDEDVEYQKAKRLLTRAARKEKDMNVFAAGSRSL